MCRECKRPAKVLPDLDANLTDRADVPDDKLDVPAGTAPAVPASRLENNPPTAATTTGSRNDRSSSVANTVAEPTKAAVLESRTDRVPKSLDFFDSTDELVAPPPAAFANHRSSSVAAAPASSPRQQLVFEQISPVIEGRSLHANQNSKPVKFIEIFGEEDAITAP